MMVTSVRIGGCPDEMHKKPNLIIKTTKQLDQRISFPII